MPTTSSSSSPSQQHDGQQKQQKQPLQQQQHSKLPEHTRPSNDFDEDFCPDPRLATAAAAAAALSRSSSSSSTTDIAGSSQTSSTTASSKNAVTSYQRLVKRYRVEVAASASSVLSTLTTFPLDSVKTRMQTYRYAGFLDCVKHTYNTEKFRGFFRGVTAPMASITLVRTVSFSIYQRSKYAYCDWVKRKFGVDVMAHVSSTGSYPNAWSIATFGAAGATAGSCITAIACKLGVGCVGVVGVGRVLDLELRIGGERNRGN
jgi:hypothetical protein